MSALAGDLDAVVLSTESIARSKAFYRSVFAAEWIGEDPVSVMFRLGPIVVVLIARDAAAELTRPSPPGRDADAAKVVLTLRVPDADAACALLSAKGVAILDGPADRPWGRRTATFADPAGHVWEIAQVLPPPPTP